MKGLVNLSIHVKPRLSIMVWGAIYRQGRSPLVIMERDKTSKGKGYTAKSYQKALAKGLIPIHDGTRQFQQDNAPIHNFGGTPEWLLENMVQWIDWPPHSPDLNPIEHVWKALKLELLKRFPDLNELKNNELHRAKLIECIEIAWEAIPQSTITSLIDSLPDRLRAVIAARGYYTKY